MLDWGRIQQRYATLLAEARVRRGLTQQQIADAGGLSGQNAISRLLANEHRGPSVETFVRAVHGLGVPLSVFFAVLEDDDPRDDRPPADRQRALEHVMAVQRDGVSSGKTTTHETPQSSSTPPIIYITDQQQLQLETFIATLITNSFVRIESQLLHPQPAHRILGGVLPTVDADPAVPPPVATPRRRARRPGS